MKFQTVQINLLKLGRRALVQYFVCLFFIFVFVLDVILQLTCIFLIDIDWSKVAIGSLPHTILGPEELDLTEVEWVRVEREYQNKDPTGRGDQKRMGDRFDWNTLSRKRRRRGGQNKEIIMTL